MLPEVTEDGGLGRLPRHGGVRVGACETPQVLGDVDAAVPCIQRFARQTDRRGVDVLLFPECFRVRFGINICYDTQFPAAAASVAAQTARLLLVPAQNMMRRAAAIRWKDEHHRIRCERARETGMWLVSADVTGARDAHRVGYGPTSVINPYGEVVAQAPLMTTSMVVADIH